MGKQTKESLIPIDIHYDKLVDWMIDRNKTSVQWAKNLPALRERISQYLSELPFDIRNKYDIGHTVHYWICLEIFKLLEKEEIKANDSKSIKNMFGNYQNNVLQNWSQLINDYKKQNICLAEAGRLLAQAVNFDIPNLKHTISSNDKQLSDIGRKLADCESSVKKFQREYDEACSKMNLKGINIRDEILQSVSMLDNLLVKVERSALVPQISESIVYYRSFAEYALKKSFNDKIRQDKDDINVDKSLLLKNLENIINERQKLETVSDSSDDFVKIDELSIVENKIDNENNITDEISWDITIDSTGAIETLDMNLDNNTDELNMNDADNDSIDWGFELADSGNDIDKNNDISLAKANTDQEFQFPVTSLLDESTVRNNFLVDLLELEAFLLERIHQATSAHSKSMHILSDANAPKCLQLVGLEKLESMKEHVQNIINELKDSKLQQLLLIRSSSLYVDRLVDTIQKKISSVERLKRTIDTLHDRQSDLQQSVQRCTHKLVSTVAYVKELQKYAESYLSKQYNDREVNIFGDINTI